MPANQSINIAALTDEAIRYQEDLRLLPYVVLTDKLNKLGVRLLELQYKDIEKTFQRKKGLARPYQIRQSIAYNDLGKVTESTLEIYECYAALKDHILNYREKNVINTPDFGMGRNQTKEHHLNGLITAQAVITVAEDIADALFHGERDDSGLSPLDCIDGYYTLIDNAVATGEIASANGNLVATGSIDAPANSSDTDAVDKLVSFVRQTDIQLRRSPNAGLIMSINTLQNAMDALQNYAMFTSRDVNPMVLQDYINNKCGTNIALTYDEILGSGDKLILTVAGNMDHGMNTMGDSDFVQIRDIFEDPNLVQYWIQWENGNRIRNLHRKMFCTNDGTSIASDLSGDYSS